MTRQQITQHLAAVAIAVYLAAEIVKPQWQPRRRAAKDADDAYFQAIAEEMLRSYSDEELQRLYPDGEVKSEE